MKANPLIIEDVARLAITEAIESQEEWGGFNSFHEGMAVLDEEREELWDECKIRQPERDRIKIQEEAIQVAAQALKIAALAAHLDWVRR